MMAKAITPTIRYLLRRSNLFAFPSAEFSMLNPSEPYGMNRRIRATTARMATRVASSSVLLSAFSYLSGASGAFVILDIACLWWCRRMLGYKTVTQRIRLSPTFACGLSSEPMSFPQRASCSTRRHFFGLLRNAGFLTGPL